MRVRRALVAAALTLAPLGVAVTAAPPAVAEECTIHIGKTENWYNVISGNGSITSGCPSGTEARLVIWRSRWFGWEPMESELLTGPGSKHISYDCTGTGTHDFQTTIMFVASGYSKTSNTINVVCDF